MIASLVLAVALVLTPLRPNAPGVVQRPFEIPYDALLPKADEVANLLAAVALSASHLRFNAVRMEPTWMIAGQAAGVAAVMAIEAVATGGGASTPLHALNVSELQRRLERDGQRIWP